MKYKVISEHPSIKSGLYLTRLSSDSNYFRCDGLTSNNIHVIHIEDWLRKGWIKPIQETLTPGKYYAISTDKWMVYITSKHSGYGFNHEGEWFTLDNPKYEWGFLESMYEITKEQFYNRLLEYAKEKYPHGTLVRWSLWAKGIIYKLIKPSIGLDDNVIFAEVKDGENSKTVTLFEDGLWIDIIPHDSELILDLTHNPPKLSKRVKKMIKKYNKKFSKKDMISFAKYAKSYSNPKDVDECFEKWNNRRNQVDLLSL